MPKVLFTKNNLTQFQSDLIQILNLMKPLSVEIGDYLDTYTAKVTLVFEGQPDEKVMFILQEAASLSLKESFCATCDVFAYDLDENGNAINCYMFKKPISYKYDAYPDRINVEIEFNVDEQIEYENLNPFLLLKPREIAISIAYQLFDVFKKVIFKVRIIIRKKGCH